MDIYQKIAADTSAPRDVRAKALLRLAGCDEKLGKQAKQVYEQIVHDYADQPAAAQARNRLSIVEKAGESGGANDHECPQDRMGWAWRDEFHATRMAIEPCTGLRMATCTLAI